MKLADYSLLKNSDAKILLCGTISHVVHEIDGIAPGFILRYYFFLLTDSSKIT